MKVKLHENYKSDKLVLIVENELKALILFYFIIYFW